MLGNYPGGDPAGVLLAIDEGLPGNAVLAQGNGGTGSDKATRRCLAAIGRARARIVAHILKSSSSCQRGRDKRAVTFGPLEDACVGTGRTAMAKATTSIRRLCAGVGAPGACTPLPECATDAARRLGQGLARSVYGTAAGEPKCGNGTVEGPEQCDDSNTVTGDGCSARCETEARSCGAAIGTRAVLVSVSTPEPLAALRIDLDYPQYAAGVTGTAQSGLVQGQVSVVQGTATAVAMLANDRDSDLTVLLGSARGFIATGALLDVAMDSCVALGENICNRNQNVFGCCPGGDVGNTWSPPRAVTTGSTGSSAPPGPSSSPSRRSTCPTSNRGEATASKATTTRTATTSCRARPRSSAT